MSYSTEELKYVHIYTTIDDVPDTNTFHRQHVRDLLAVKCFPKSCYM